MRFPLLTRRRVQHRCFHHDPGEPWPDGTNRPVSFLHSWLIDSGMRKMWQCSACGKVWFF
jgi:hypothetical protein